MHLRLTLCAVALLSLSASAKADTYSFSFGSSTAAFNGSGLLTTGDAVAFGEFPITAISGTVSTMPGGALLNIATLLPAGSFPTPSNGGTLPSNDDVLFVLNGVGRPDEDGFSFLVDGGAQINLFNDGPGIDAVLLPSNGALVYESVALSITPLAATPEPESLVLLGTGLLAGLYRTRRGAL